MKGLGWRLGLYAFLFSPLAVPPQAWAAESKPAIKDIMAAVHKKPKELLKKVATGAATDAGKC